MTRATAILRTAGSDIEYRVIGSGDPVTLYAHGLTGSIDDTRPFASGVPGTAVFCHLRGHGATRVQDGRWDLDAVAGDVRAVADHTSARQAFGLSLGAAALVRLLGQTPDRFDRAVVMFPGHSTKTAVNPSWARIADLVERADIDGTARLLLATQSARVRALPEATAYYQRVAGRLVEWGEQQANALRALPAAMPAADTADLSRITVPVLVIARRDDPLHPAGAAAELAASLPNAELVELGEADGLWFGRDQVRRSLSAFLGRG